MDNLERAIESAGSDENSNSCVVEGVEMTLKAILKVFDQFQVKPIESMGKPFDPLFHQAMMQEESDERTRKYGNQGITKRLSAA